MNGTNPAQIRRAPLTRPSAAERETRIEAVECLMFYRSFLELELQLERYWVLVR